MGQNQTKMAQIFHQQVYKDIGIWTVLGIFKFPNSNASETNWFFLSLVFCNHK